MCMWRQVRFEQLRSTFVMFYTAKIPKIVKKVAPSIVYAIPETDKALYLTFDDGPIPETTPQILALLAKYNAKATFFCLGKNVEEHPELFQAILDEGHTVGNHTYSHKNGWKTKNKDYYNDIERAGKFIDSKLFRPPYGRIKPIQINYLKRKYKIVMWDVLSGDFDPETSKKKSLNNIINNVEKGSVIVLHDSLKAQENMLYALRGTLEHFSKLDYQFKAIRP